MIAKEKKTVKFMCDLSAEQESKQVLMTAADYDVVNQEITSLQPNSREEARLKILNEWNMNCDEEEDDDEDEEEDDDGDYVEDNYGDDEINSCSDDSSSLKQNDSSTQKEEGEEEGFQSACEGHVYDNGSCSRACSLQLEVAHEDAVPLHRNCFGADLYTISNVVDKGTDSSTDDTVTAVEYNIWNPDNSGYRKKQVKSLVNIPILACGTVHRTCL